MPFFANTPESRLGRSDSRNPSTTCRGITSSGRPCRRPVAGANASADASPLPPSSRLRVDDPRDERLYCWQHKDQASASAKSSPGPRASHTPILEERTSIDTLADRLGLISAQAGRPQHKPHPGSGRPDGRASGKQPQRPTKMTRPKPKKEAVFCFCFRIPVDEIEPPPRPKPQPIQPAVSTTPAVPGARKHSKQYPMPSPSRLSPGRLSRRSSGASQTAQFMSLIPHDASPQTASLLLAELAKSISPQDEPGYIYIFWLTPESEPSTPPAEAARSLLAPPATPTRQRGGGRRPSDVLASFARPPAQDADDDEAEDADWDGAANRGGVAGSADRSKKNAKVKTILLKIGRATNVQRRLNEWQRQCGYNLSLIRYYPYVPSSSASPSPSSRNSPSRSPGRGGGVVPRKMPHSHKVERLVHIELAGRGLRVADRERCEACGREHREWFEVPATRTAVADVDEVVRRWSDWDEGLA